MPFAGSVLQLGRQDVFLAEFQLREDVLGLGLNPQSISKEWNSEAGTEDDSGWLSDRRLFRLLGFDNVLSCDVSAYEDAEILLDLDKWGKIANSKKMGIFCVVQKTSDSRCDIVPSQSYYQRLWLERPLDRQKSYAAPLKTYFKTRLPSLCEPLFWVRSLARHVFHRDQRSVLPLVGKF